MESRVVIASRNDRFDTSAAEEHGNIVYLFDRGPRPSALNPQTLHDEIVDRLELLGYDPEKDFIALTGSTIQTSVLLATVMSIYEGCQMLLFDATRDEYVQRRLEHPSELLY